MKSSHSGESHSGEGSAHEQVQYDYPEPIKPEYRDGRLYHPAFEGGSIPARVPPHDWDQDASIQYELAVETTYQVVGAISAAEAKEEAKPQPNQAFLEECMRISRDWILEVRKTDPGDKEAVARIIERNKQTLREWRDK